MSQYRYKVLRPGFIQNKTFSPNGKRNVVYSDVKLKPVPSWLEEMKPETAAEKKKREAVEKEQSIAAAEKAEEDKQDIASVTFTDPVVSTPGSVETL